MFDGGLLKPRLDWNMLFYLKLFLWVTFYCDVNLRHYNFAVLFFTLMTLSAIYKEHVIN